MIKEFLRHAEMDLQVYFIILIVFLVSFLSYLFISKFLPHGKTFDEMIAEKKRLREEVLGAVKTLSNKQSNAGNKKKPKKEVKKRDSQSKSAKEVTSNESDASESSEAVISEPATPTTLVLRKNPAKAQQAQQPGKKGKGKSGILVNKNEPVLVKDTSIEEEANHFEEIHPKDAVEIHRAAVKEEVEKKHFRDNKKAKPVKVETPPISPKNQPAKEQKPAEEKPARKKRNEHSTSAVDSGTIQLVSDETGIKPLIRDLSRADLTKNQIQVLIDFLLNRQSDTIVHDPTEWSEGKSDVMQKLKKQLQEKEAQLKNEQDALSGMQNKLKELRGEFNSEKVQFNANLKAHTEQLQNSRMEIKNLQSEIQFLSDKHNSEKQSMTVAFKQLQTQCIQMKENLKVHEGLPNIQQLQNDNALLQQEIAGKTQQLIAFTEEIRQKDEQLKQLALERDNKIAEVDVHSRKKDDRISTVESELRQKVQDLATRDNELQKLNAEVARGKEVQDKVVQRQSFDLEQLKKQLIDQEQNNHAEESNKIEIRNLQNALDSSKKELESQRMLVSDYKAKQDDLNKQLAESKQITNSKASGDSFLLNEKINELVSNHQNVMGQKDKQLADFQKQVDTLQKAESELTKLIDEQKAKNNTHSSVDVTKVKEIFAQHFPEATSSSVGESDGTKWLESVLENLKQQIVSNKSSLSNSTNNSPIANNNHQNNSSDKLNSALNGDSHSSTSQVAENELVLLQNAQLKTTVDEYKMIIAETESMLKNLESKVREQDAYWTKVVLMKDNEIEKLKPISEKS